MSGGGAEPVMSHALLDDAAQENSVCALLLRRAAGPRDGQEAAAAFPAFRCLFHAEAKLNPAVTERFNIRIDIHGSPESRVHLELAALDCDGRAEFPTQGSGGPAGTPSSGFVPVK